MRVKLCVLKWALKASEISKELSKQRLERLIEFYQ